MKKKLILCSSLAALSMAAVISLTSCGGVSTGDVKTVTPEVLDSTLVQSDSKKVYSKFIATKNSAYVGGYIVVNSENKIYNAVTAKSVDIANLSDYTTANKQVYYGGGYTYFFATEKTIDSQTTLYTIYNNSMQKVAEFRKKSGSNVYINYSKYRDATKDGKKVIYTTLNIEYRDVDNNDQYLYPEIEVSSSGVVTNKESDAKKNSSTYEFSEFQTGLYTKITYEEENTVYHFYDSSYNDICELTTDVDVTFSTIFNNKVYAQGMKLVPESNKNAIAVYSSKKDTYTYMEIKTYCIDIEKQKAKEIDTEVIFRNDLAGNKNSEYMVADYYKITNNFVNTDYLYTGFFKDGELEYGLPMTIVSMSDITKVGDNYLIEDDDYANFYDKDLKLINWDISANVYGVYSDSKNFKNNFYDFTGKLIYSTENVVDTSHLDDYGYAIESKDGQSIKALVFNNGTVSTVELNENIRFVYDLMITRDTTNTNKYTIKQIGGTASIDVYSNYNISISRSSSDYVTYSLLNTTYSDSNMTLPINYLYGIY